MPPPVIATDLKLPPAQPALMHGRQLSGAGASNGDFAAAGTDRVAALQAPHSLIPLAGMTFTAVLNYIAGGQCSQCSQWFDTILHSDGVAADRLEQASKASGRSRQQELLTRLEASFDRDTDLPRDPSMRAFCYLFSQLAESIHLNTDNWRSDPWLFRAVQLAIGKLLDAFKPAGKVKRTDFWEFLRQGNAPELSITKEMRQVMTRSPEAMADHMVKRLLLEFAKPVPRHKLWRASEHKIADPDDRRMFGLLMADWSNTFYGKGAT